MLLLLRQGKISKWFSGIGQEAISVGATMALDKDEYILPLHRNLGVFVTREINLKKLFAQFQGKPYGFTKGRDRSFHFGSKESHIIGMISHLGAQMGLANGIAYANKVRKNNKCTLVFTGDGGASEGDFHEALNIASVWSLPVIFLVENNGYGLSTPSKEQFAFKNFVDKAPGYGIESVKIDGNNLLEVYEKLSEVVYKIRKKSKPILIECITFRMRGHEEASGTKYVPKQLQEEWAKKDPILLFEKHIKSHYHSVFPKLEYIKKTIREEINLEWKKSEVLPEATFKKEIELKDVYSFFDNKEINKKTEKTEKTEKRFVDALLEALEQSMERHDNLILMGQDIAEYGGVFKVTDGLFEKFGKFRVRNTPLCESAVVGMSLGLSILGYKSMVEMQFADFVSEAMTQICNNIAKSHYRWGQNADVVIRMPTGAGVNAGPFHSQSNEGWFTQIPGLKVVYPAFPEDAKGLLCQSFNDPNPIIFFEHKALYRSLKGTVPKDYFTIPIGKSQIVKKGSLATIVSYGQGVHWSLRAVKQLGVDIEIIDLRTLRPLDEETIFKSVKKTGKVLIISEANLFSSFSGEIAALISEYCFEFLDAPVMRLGAIETPVPFAKELEIGYLPENQILKTLKKLINY